ncbi:capsule assembly Wzi family protein [Marinobacter sp. AC-23]|uniref:capsule assembly Wzi family protein n=1 Tax=Marinobacter sp. AC-23 TaxID=1879031 RepID=UPI0008DE9786|nr:capsule assembly Wzi family protein [Marinobacter sp. AC-23]OHY79852.1 hypothetical protein BCA33_15365 [Marinobacter sp. AC-23]
MTALSAQTVHASPWFEPSDSYARFKLQQSADREDLDATVTTWPLARSNAKSDWATNPIGGTASFFINGSTDPRFVRGFDGGVREAGQVGVNLEYIGDAVAIGLSPSYAIDPTDDEAVRFDGSYLAATQYNWTVGAGFIDRWWGPGWQSSMILSSNARPVPSVWLNPFEGINAVFQAYDGEERAIVLINFMQKQQRVKVPVSAIRS